MGWEWDEVGGIITLVSKSVIGELQHGKLGTSSSRRFAQQIADYSNVSPYNLRQPLVDYLPADIR